MAGYYSDGWVVFADVVRGTMPELQPFNVPNELRYALGRFFYVMAGYFSLRSYNIGCR